MKIKQIHVSCRLVKGFTLLKRVQIQLKKFIGYAYRPGKYCLNREKFESLDGYVTTRRSFYDCGNCGAWMFVHKFP